jgi:hypothetical protein
LHDIGGRRIVAAPRPIGPGEAVPVPEQTLALLRTHHRRHAGEVKRARQDSNLRPVD